MEYYCNNNSIDYFLELKDSAGNKICKDIMIANLIGLSLEKFYKIILEECPNAYVKNEDQLYFSSKKEVEDVIPFIKMMIDNNEKYKFTVQNNNNGYGYNYG